MSEYTLVLVLLVLLSLAVGMVFFRRKFKAEIWSDAGTDYVITLWVERGEAPGLASASSDLEPHKITAEYHVSFTAASPEQQVELRGHYAQKATTDFHRRFTPMFEDFNIGALRFEPADEIED